MTRARMFAAFFAVAWGLSWVIVAVMTHRFGAEAIRGNLGRIVILMCALPPLLATLITQGPLLRQGFIKPLGVRFKMGRWWLVAWFAPLIVFTVAIGVLAATGAEVLTTAAELLALKQGQLTGSDLDALNAMLEESSPPSPWMLVLQALPAGITLNALYGFCAELAWRGFVFKEAPGGFWQRTAWTSGAEFLWLLPAVLMGALFGVGGVQATVAWLVFCLALGPIQVYLRARSESIFPAAIFRGTLLALVPVATDVLPKTAPWLRPTFGLSSALGLVVVLGLLAWHDRWTEAPSLMRKSPAESQ